MPISMPKTHDPTGALSRGIAGEIRHRREAATGFTLVEMMVVIFIVGMLATVVVLNMPSGSREVLADADRFAQRIAAARDEAVLESQPIALWVSASGYGFERRSEGAWQPVEQGPFRATDWRGSVAQVPAAGARIVFDSVGLPSEAVAIPIEQGGARRVVSIDAAGEVSVDG